MTDSELRDVVARAAMAAMGAVPAHDPFVLQEEQLGGEVNAGHHGMSGGGSSNPGCFEFRPAKTNGESDPGGFDNPYYSVGARLYSAPNLVSAGGSGYSGKVVAVVITLTGSQPTASIVAVDSFADLQELADDPDVAVKPLYDFGSGDAIAVDLRNMPTLVSKEFAGS